MKNIDKYTFLFLSLLLSQVSFGQELSKREKLDQLTIKFEAQEKQEKAEAFAIAIENGWDTIGLFRINEFGNPEYILDDNYFSSISVNTLFARNTYGLDGSGMTIGIWEAGSTANPGGQIPLTTHQDFQSRVTIKDGTPLANNSSHATHVGGTMVGSPPSGVSIASTGMAPNANLDAYAINNHNAEMATAGAASIDEVDAGKLLLSNHSYGTNEGWSRISGTDNYQWNGGTASFIGGGVDPAWGVYTSNDVAWDDIAFNAPYYLICKSSGNQNVHNPTNLVRNGGSGTLVPYNSTIHPLGDGLYAGGFRTVSSGDLGKNMLTVGATNHPGVIANFSCQGPTADGRIKPDITGVGVNINSATNSSNTSYGLSSGTSMSTPNVSGSLLLLQEKYKEDFTVGSDHLYMKAATLKALAIHTAEDLGNTGPDYTYGWGRLDMEPASNLINDDAWKDPLLAGQHMIIEDFIMSASHVYEIEVNTGGGIDANQFKVTMVYPDPTGSTLINDLDLTVFNETLGFTLDTWLLDPNNPSADATSGDDDINNVEKTSFNFGANNKVIIKVLVEGALHNNTPQPFSLIISGLSTTCHGTIQHKLLDLPSDTYTAKDYIKSQAKLVTAGREITYQTNGKIELKPGFHAKAQTSAGAGFFKTSAGTCP